MLELGKRYYFYTLFTSDGKPVGRRRSGLLWKYDKKFGYLTDRWNTVWHIHLEHIMEKDVRR